MRHILKSIFLAALLTQANAVLAQEITEETPPNQASPDDGLSLGQAVEPRIGEPYIREDFADWAVRCIKAPEGQTDRCNLYQLLTDDDGRAVAEFNIFGLPEGGRAIAGATIVVPLETLLTEQLTLTVDGRNARRYPITYCNRAGCVARVGFTQAEVDEFRSGSSATLRLVPAATPDQPVVLTVSLAGFTAGFDSARATGQ